MSNPSVMEQITICDEYGFQNKPWFWWLPESPEDELKRLETNIRDFKWFVKFGEKFSEGTLAQRDADFNRIQVLKGLR